MYIVPRQEQHRQTMSKYLVKRGRSPPAAAVVYPEITEEDVASAADMLPELLDIAVTVRTLIPEGWNEMDVALDKGLELLLFAAVTYNLFRQEPQASSSWGRSDSVLGTLQGYRKCELVGVGT